jgi:hypothetical protein
MSNSREYPSIVEVVGATSQLELIRGPDTC